VTGLSPKEGSTEGGTHLTIRGSNLGHNKDDVIGLYVCGSNVLSTLEYFSPSKLVCTTKPHKPCCGTITVETQAGGRGMSLVKFSFIDTASSSSSATNAAVSTVPAAAVPVSATAVPVSSVPASAAAVPASSSVPATSVPAAAVPASSVQYHENYSDSTSECSSSLSRSSSRGDADVKREASIKVTDSFVICSFTAVLLCPSTCFYVRQLC